MPEEEEGKEVQNLPPLFVSRGLALNFVLFTA
jgi:hypothetical protein